MNDYRRIDEWGRVIVNPSAAPRLILRGYDVWAMPVDIDSDITAYNELCRRFDKGEFTIRGPEPIDQTPEQVHAAKIDHWLVADDIKDIPVRDFVLSLCTRDDERARVEEEMALFEERGLLPLLQLMIFLVDNFRQRGVVWGVGRGSSVASYVLYLIGVHKIDSIRFGLPIDEFLK